MKTQFPKETWLAYTETYCWFCFWSIPSTGGLWNHPSDGWIFLWGSLSFWLEPNYRKLDSMCFSRHAHWGLQVPSRACTSLLLEQLLLPRNQRDTTAFYWPVFKSLPSFPKNPLDRCVGGVTIKRLLLKYLYNGTCVFSKTLLWREFPKWCLLVVIMKKCWVFPLGFFKNNNIFKYIFEIIFLFFKIKKAFK